MLSKSNNSVTILSALIVCVVSRSPKVCHIVNCRSRIVCSADTTQKQSKSLTECDREGELRKKKHHTHTHTHSLSVTHTHTHSLSHSHTHFVDTCTPRTGPLGQKEMI